MIMMMIIMMVMKIMISTGSRASTRSSGGPGASATTGRSHPPGIARRQTPGQEQESVITKATARLLSVCLSRYFNRKSLLVFPSLSKIKFNHVMSTRLILIEKRKCFKGLRFSWRILSSHPPVNWVESDQIKINRYLISDAVILKSEFENSWN